MATGCVACALELASWIYGAASFIVVSVTFPSICHLQILRLREFAASISHRFRGCSWMVMVMVTANQFAAVLVTTRRRSYGSLFNTGELASFAIDISKSDSEFPVLNGDCDSDELECMEIVHPHGRTIFFQKRRAFVTYLENNGAGITIFMLEITSFLWLLGNTIWISRSHRFWITFF
ncbi:unnamed protein product [Musa textilis]